MNKTRKKSDADSFNTPEPFNYSTCKFTFTGIWMGYDSGCNTAISLISKEDIHHEDIKPVLRDSSFSTDRHPVQFSGSIMELQEWQHRS
jgi:hypothetical protein